MSNSFQFLSYYILGLSVSLFILPESEIHKLSFKPANPHPSFSSSDVFNVSRYSVMFASLPPQGSPTMSSANIMDSGSYLLTPSLSRPYIHEYEEQAWAQGRSLVQTHIHVE